MTTTLPTLASSEFEVDRRRLLHMRERAEQHFKSLSNWEKTAYYIGSLVNFVMYQDDMDQRRRAEKLKSDDDASKRTEFRYRASFQDERFPLWDINPIEGTPFAASSGPQDDPNNPNPLAPTSDPYYLSYYPGCFLGEIIRGRKHTNISTVYAMGFPVGHLEGERVNADFSNYFSGARERTFVGSSEATDGLQTAIRTKSVRLVSKNHRVFDLEVRLDPTSSVKFWRRVTKTLAVSNVYLRDGSVFHFTEADVAKIYDDVARCKKKKEAILFHCASGRGRTGLMLLACSILHHSTRLLDRDPSSRDMTLTAVCRAIYALLESLRDVRPGLVENPKQFTNAIHLGVALVIHERVSMLYERIQTQIGPRAESAKLTSHRDAIEALHFLGTKLRHGASLALLSRLCAEPLIVPSLYSADTWLMLSYALSCAPLKDMQFGAKRSAALAKVGTAAAVAAASATTPDAAAKSRASIAVMTRLRAAESSPSSFVLLQQQQQHQQHQHQQHQQSQISRQASGTLSAIDYRLRPTASLSLVSPRSVALEPGAAATATTTTTTTTTTAATSTTLPQSTNSTTTALELQGSDHVLEQILELKVAQLDANFFWRLGDAYLARYQANGLPSYLFESAVQAFSAAHQSASQPPTSTTRLFIAQLLAHLQAIGERLKDTHSSNDKAALQRLIDTITASSSLSTTSATTAVQGLASSTSSNSLSSIS